MLQILSVMTILSLSILITKTVKFLFVMTPKVEKQLIITMIVTET